MRARPRLSREFPTRRRNRLANIGKSRKMHHGIDLMRSKNCSERCGIADIPFNQLPPANELAMTEQQVAAI